MDIMTRSRRSELMGRITGNHLKPETAMARALRRAGCPARRNVKSLPGKPDLVLPELAVFVHGCF